jgi:hypothetical protein
VAVGAKIESRRAKSLVSMARGQVCRVWWISCQVVRPDEHGDVAVIEGNQERRQSSESRRLKSKREWGFMYKHVYGERSWMSKNGGEMNRFCLQRWEELKGELQEECPSVNGESQQLSTFRGERGRRPAACKLLQSEKVDLLQLAFCIVEKGRSRLGVLNQ